MSYSESKFALRFPAWFVPALLAAAFVLLVIGTGCATTDESEMPWNMPQTWEGTMPLPGMPPP